MTAPDFSNYSTPDALLGAIDAYIERAHTALAARDMATLLALDKVVDRVCEQIKESDVLTAESYSSRFAQVIERIDILQSAMLDMQKEVAGSIKSLNGAKKANNAYNSVLSGKAGK